jgi:hypothetical protein
VLPSEDTMVTRRRGLTLRLELLWWALLFHTVHYL